MKDSESIFEDKIGRLTQALLEIGPSETMEFTSEYSDGSPSSSVGD
jgi:hypothetical protein